MVKINKAKTMKRVIKSSAFYMNISVVSILGLIATILALTNQIVKVEYLNVCQLFVLGFIATAISSCLVADYLDKRLINN